MEDPPGRDRLTAMSKSFQGESAMTSLARKGGIAASILLIAMGIGAMVMGVTGRDTIRSDLAREQIVGTPDSAIPGQKVDTGGEAQEFAAVIRKHTLEATGGETYAQMGRFLDESGKPTGDEAAAAKDRTPASRSASPTPLWWPPTKIAGRYLAPYLLGDVASKAFGPRPDEFAELDATTLVPVRAGLVVTTSTSTMLAQPICFACARRSARVSSSNAGSA
jgi:hypothetical protein